VPLDIVFTKADKLSESKVKANVNAYVKTMLETWEEMPPYFITSSDNARGRDEVLNYIDQINQSLKLENGKGNTIS
jgi:GTP-binding protein